MASSDSGRQRTVPLRLLLVVRGGTGMELSDLTLALVAACSRAQRVLSVADTPWYVTFGTCEMQAAHIHFKQRVTTH